MLEPFASYWFLAVTVASLPCFALACSPSHLPDLCFVLAPSPLLVRMHAQIWRDLLVAVSLIM
jgi:hypothetical protein